ncbi:uncharacterized protein LOC115749528 [Rhodamnia argentea]|uniref:Uncharacterized protein LOC115749528 n=1 Tax=Rhodamnia argentea TaxID=178133 RepID=A0A8B8Q576_9MYRT|nr:uncharacterized protein LOC115749528 [Rhodamnia argentea]
MVREPVDSSKMSSALKFLCSYGGKIVLRKSDGELRYVGGFTRILSVDRSISYAELMVKLMEFCGFSVALRCMLPDGDLETLISVKSDEDLANLIAEYDRASLTSASPKKIRAVLSPPESLKVVSPAASSTSSIDLSARNSPTHATGDPWRTGSRSPPVHSQVRAGKLRCYPFYVEPRKVWVGGHCCKYCH